MHYYLAAPPQERIVDITEQQFRALESAKRSLSCALAIEETYEILVSNYLAFECYLFEQAAVALVRQEKPYARHFQIRLGAIAQVVNILTSARMYIDHVPRLTRDCHADEAALLSVRTFLAREYDGHVECRFMEALRNHVQHVGLPVHWTQEGVRWTSHDEDAHIEVYLEIASLKSTLAADPQFKKATLEELDEKTDVKHATKRYLECLGSVHKDVRELLAEPTRLAREQIEAAHRQYGDPAPVVAVTLAAIAEDTEPHRKIPLLLTGDDQRRELMQRNRTLSNLHRSHVTDKARTLRSGSSE